MTERRSIRLRSQSVPLIAPRQFSIIDDRPSYYVALDTKGQIKEHLLKLKAMSKMSKTGQTSFVEGASYRDSIRRSLEDVSYAAFNKSKLAGLRRSPAYIVWPERPPPPPGPKTTVSHVATDSATNNVPIKVRKLSTTLRCRNKGRRESSVDDDDSDTEIKVEKIVSNSSFWNYARGNVRIDCINLGAPKRDPYNSTWSHDKRRCFFTSGFVPHHRRLPNPLIVMRTSMQQEKKEPGNTTNTNNNGDNDNTVDDKVDDAIIRVRQRNQEKGDKKGGRRELEKKAERP